MVSLKGACQHRAGAGRGTRGTLGEAVMHKPQTPNATGSTAAHLLADDGDSDPLLLYHGGNDDGNQPPPGAGGQGGTCPAA